jgi:hypothetical protein
LLVPRIDTGPSQRKLQMAIYRLNKTACKYDMKISTSKIKVMGM